MAAQALGVVVKDSRTDNADTGNHKTNVYSMNLLSVSPPWHRSPRMAATEVALSGKNIVTGCVAKYHVARD